MRGGRRILSGMHSLVLEFLPLPGIYLVAARGTSSKEWMMSSAEMPKRKEFSGQIADATLEMELMDRASSGSIPCTTPSKKSPHLSRPCNMGEAGPWLLGACVRQAVHGPCHHQCQAVQFLQGLLSGHHRERWRRALNVTLRDMASPPNHRLSCKCKMAVII